MPCARDLVVSIAVIATAAAFAATAAETEFIVSRQVTPAREYTFGIEGPAVDAGGTLYS